MIFRHIRTLIVSIFTICVGLFWSSPHCTKALSGRSRKARSWEQLRRVTQSSACRVCERIYAMPFSLVRGTWCRVYVSIVCVLSIMPCLFSLVQHATSHGHAIPSIRQCYQINSITSFRMEVRPGIDKHHSHCLCRLDHAAPTPHHVHMPCISLHRHAHNASMQRSADWAHCVDIEMKVQWIAIRQQIAQPSFTSHT